MICCNDCSPSFRTFSSSLMQLDKTEVMLFEILGPTQITAPGKTEETDVKPRMRMRNVCQRKIF
jgi:hypothetical protein